MAAGHCTAAEHLTVAKGKLMSDHGKEEKYFHISFSLNLSFVPK